MAEEFDTLKKVESLDELRSIPTGTEVIVTRHSLSADGSFTVHGKFQKANTSAGTTFVDLADHLQLPLEISVDPSQPKHLLEFLRGFSDPRYEREAKALGYNVFGFPDSGYDVYRVEEH